MLSRQFQQTRAAHLQHSARDGEARRDARAAAHQVEAGRVQVVRLHLKGLIAEVPGKGTRNEQGQ